VSIQFSLKHIFQPLRILKLPPSLTPSISSPVTTQTNARGIPVAPFIDNVSDYVSSRAEVEPTLRSFQEMISKYQFMEVNTQRRGQGLREKIPDIKKTLEMVRFLKLRKEVGVIALRASPEWRN
jgi:hypothetical protein